MHGLTRNRVQREDAGRHILASHGEPLTVQRPADVGDDIKAAPISPVKLHGGQALLLRRGLPYL
jgi:hypothetical protein